MTSSASLRGPKRRTRRIGNTPRAPLSPRLASKAIFLASRENIHVFRKAVWAHWKMHGRHELPWRKTKDPYRILVSEVMLQQTQVPRVIPKYKEFIKIFPTARVLAKAPLRDVLRHWSGLGYNRRAKYLHDAAKEMVEKHRGSVPRDATALQALPGIGEYTAAAIRAFAFNEPAVLVETNVRTAIIYHFFNQGDTLVRDAELVELARAVGKGQESREWNWALMDHGAYLKQRGVRVNARNAHYVKQSKFEGSMRQLRGQILRELHAGKQPKLTARSRKALIALARDGLIKRRKGKCEVA